MTDRLALEFISALGMAPDAMAALVADLGLTRFGLAAQPITRAPAFAPWSLLEDPDLRLRTRAAMERCGVSLSLAEGFLVRPDQPVSIHIPAFDLMAELGAPRVNLVNLGGGGEAAIDAVRDFGRHARERGMRTTIEFLPMLAPGTFAAALAFAERAEVQVLVDAMHFFRSGGQVDELTAAADRIGYVQICDVPLPATAEDYGLEASHDRLQPGEGDLPLAAFLAALPTDVPVGLELPMMRHASPDVDMRALLAPAVAATRRLISSAPLQSPRQRP